MFTDIPGLIQTTERPKREKIPIGIRGKNHRSSLASLTGFSFKKATSPLGTVSR